MPRASNNKRVLIYSHDTFGLGHLRRKLGRQLSTVVRHADQQCRLAPVKVVNVSHAAMLGRIDDEKSQKAPSLMSRATRAKSADIERSSS